MQKTPPRSRGNSCAEVPPASRDVGYSSPIRLAVPKILLPVHYTSYRKDSHGWRFDENGKDRWYLDPSTVGLRYLIEIFREIRDE